MIRKRAPKRFEAWQIIYIDLMTNIMITFVILWSISQGKQNGVDETIGNESAQMVTLPGDVLFDPGRSFLSTNGKQVFKNLFLDKNNQSVLSFESSPMTKRMLVIHGHTDGDGSKAQNLDLGFQRALSAFQEISSYSKELSEHVIICSHADNTPAVEVPKFSGKLSAAQQTMAKDAKAKNRRITIEDKILERLLVP
jgi:outer membrane protein OmpA-like peptidoglycan-associated protein